MGICKECKFYTEEEREINCKLPERPVNQKSLINKVIVSKMHVGMKEILGVCNNRKHVKKNYISGISLEEDVALFNAFGQCELFVDLNEETPPDIPEYPKLQLVVSKKEILPEEELPIKCYAHIQGDGKLSYRWFLGEVPVEEDPGDEEPKEDETTEDTTDENEETIDDGTSTLSLEDEEDIPENPEFDDDEGDDEGDNEESEEEPKEIEYVEIEDATSYECIFSSEKEGEFIVRCEVTNTDKSCMDRQTSTSYVELDVVVSAPKEESPEEENPEEPESGEEGEGTESEGDKQEPSGDDGEGSDPDTSGESEGSEYF